MLRLLLMRHAKALHSAQFDDFDRPLVAKGREGATLIGAYIACERYRPERALVSAAQRTRETWEIVKEYTGQAEPRFERGLYHASPSDILAAIRATEADVSTLLVIGHNPGLALLAASLPGSGEEDWLRDLRSKFPTSAFAAFAFEGDDWASIRPGTGRLEHFVYPRLLRKEE